MGRWILAVLLLAAPVYAATKGCPSGTFANQTTTGPGADFLQITGRIPGLTLQSTMTAGTAATVTIEQSCNAGASWAHLTTVDMALTSTTATLAVALVNPVCRYRANLTTCTSCTVQVAYACP